MQEPFIFITCYVRKISAAFIHDIVFSYDVISFYCSHWSIGFQSIMIMKYYRSGPQTSENFTKNRIISGIIYEIKHFYQFLTGKLIINIIIYDDMIDLGARFSLGNLAYTQCVR